MTALLVRKALRRSLDQVRYVAPVRPARAQGLVSAVYMQVERDFGMLAPPVALHSPAPGPLAGCWLMLRDTLVTPGAAGPSGPSGRAAREVVAAAVSLGNTCPYCVAIHSAALYGLSHGQDAAALADGRIESITDPALRSLGAWARGDDAASFPVEFPVEQIPELVGVAVTFHYLNRMVNVFLDDSPLPPQVPAVARGRLMRLLGQIMKPPSSSGSLGSRPYGPDLLPPARLPGDLSWAAGNPGVANALARAAAAIDSAGARSVPGPVRELVQAELAAWDGTPPGLGRAWVEEPVSLLSPEHRPYGRLALLTALASYQVTKFDVDEMPLDDEGLIELTSWAALAAARQMGVRLETRARVTVQDTSPG